MAWRCDVGLVEYTVLRNKMLQPGKFEFALRENKEDGELVMCMLTDGQGKTNPLQVRLRLFTNRFQLKHLKNVTGQHVTSCH